MKADLINLVDRPTYGLLQVDRVLGLPSGTARRWIDGYTRGGRSYPPVIRQEPTGDDIATWGEFVETRLLSEFREAGVPMIKMRPAVDVLRDQLNTPYPLASSRTWLDTEGKELVLKVQERVGLERRLALVVVRSGQGVLTWSKPAEGFRSSVEWTSKNGADPQPRRLRPIRDLPEVTIDPLRGFGEPVVRGVRTEIIAELMRAGESPDKIAELYELQRGWVDAALRYELLRTAA